MDTLPASNVVCRWPLGECSSNNLKNFDRCPNISVFCIIALNLIISVATGGGQSEEGSWAVAAVFRQVKVVPMGRLICLNVLFCYNSS